MKIPFVPSLCVLVIALTGCMSASKNQQTSSSAGREEMLVAKEKQVWEAFKKKDAALLNELIHDNSYSIEDADGEIVTKAEALADLPNFTIDDYSMKNIQVIPINHGAAIVRYNMMVKGSSKGKPFTPHWSTVSSVWVDNKGKWQNLVYQETQILHHH